MANKISQTIAKAFMGNGRTTEFDADIGKAMSLADECEKFLRDFVLMHSEGGFVQPDAQILDEASALLAKLER